MINLLPPKEKEERSLEQVKKLEVILETAVLVAVICLILVLLSVDFYILGESVSRKFILEQAEIQYKTPDFLRYKNILQIYNKNIARVDSFYKNEAPLGAAIKEIIKIERPAGVYFSSLSLSRNESINKIEVSISGNSDTRDNLLIFKENVEKKEGVKNSNFSPESWLNPGAINFNLTFEIDGK